MDAQDVAGDAEKDVEKDAGKDAVEDAVVDVAMDVEMDAGMDVEMDVEMDAAMDVADRSRVKEMDEAAWVTNLRLLHLVYLMLGKKKNWKRMKWIPGYLVHRVHGAKELIEKEDEEVEDKDPAADAENSVELNECFASCPKKDPLQKHFRLCVVDDLATDDEEVAAGHEEVVNFAQDEDDHKVPMSEAGHKVSHCKHFQHWDVQLEVAVNAEMK